MPFKSKAQMKACFAKDDPKWDCKKWGKETPHKDKLPEKADKAEDSREKAHKEAVSNLKRLGRRFSRKDAP